MEFLDGYIWGWVSAMLTVLVWAWLAERERRKAERKADDAVLMQLALDAERHSRRMAEFCEVCHGVGACADADDGLNCAWRVMKEADERAYRS